MQKPEIPLDEEARLKSLRALGVLDTEAEERFDRITRLAKNHFDVPIALVSIVDADRQWFKSRQGLKATETGREISFCGHTILSDQTFVVRDASTHPDFSDNPLVVDDPSIRFYAGAPLHAPDGARVGTLCIIDRQPRSLTEHDLKSLRDLANCAEMELAISAVREREHFLHEIADAMPGLVAYWDKNLICRFANKQYFEWFGRTPEQVLGSSIQSLLGDQLFKLNETYIRGALAGQPQHFERTLTKADGSIGFGWAQYIPDKRGDAVAGFFVLVSDVTPLKLTEMELQKAKLEAESANKAKDRFLATVSHEIRTPITAVLGIADLLSSSDLNSEQKEWIQQLRKSSTALLGLINDILDYSKIAAGKVELDRTHFSLDDLVRDICALFAALASEKQNALDVKIAPNLCHAYYGDDKKYRQILMNLLSNANKFTHNGCIYVSVDGVRREDGLSLITTQVKDTGIGIAPENQKRLFDPFVQEDASTSRKYGGTGLGLSISKNLVELMGGSINLESIPGRGSSFSFSVLFEPSETTKIEKQAVSGIGSFTPATDKAIAKPTRVLLAEDNEAVSMLLRTVLTKTGFSVTAVADGASAVEEARRSDYDIILMDMQMPIMDGPDAMKAIRAEKHPLSSLPIIALTADAMREHRELYLGAGANAVLTKPIAWPELLSEMGRLTEATKRSR